MHRYYIYKMSLVYNLVLTRHSLFNSLINLSLMRYLTYIGWIYLHTCRVSEYEKKSDYYIMISKLPIPKHMFLQFMFF